MANQGIDWQPIAILIPIIAIVITVIIFFAQRKIKKLSYSIISNVILVKYPTEIKDKLKIYYQGNAVNDANLIVVKISNSGDIPIIPLDYSVPISFTFGKGAEILDAKVNATKPKGIKVSLNIINEKILSLDPTLLNAGDEIHFSIVIKDYRRLTIKGRINGVREIIEYREKNMYPISSLVGIACGMLLGFLTFTVLEHNLTDRDFMRWIGYMSLVFLSISLIILVFITSKRFIKTHRP